MLSAGGGVGGGGGGGRRGGWGVGEGGCQGLGTNRAGAGRLWTEDTQMTGTDPIPH